MKVQKVKDPNNLTSFEQMHLPWILIPDFVKKNEKFEVMVKVGEVDHPMTNKHYIICIRLYVNNKLIECRNLKLPNLSEAKFNISLKEDSVIKAYDECNLHGAWTAEKKVILYRGNES